MDYLCFLGGSTDGNAMEMALTLNANVPESVAPGQEFQLTNTSLIAHVEQSTLNYFVSPSFSINSENTETTITKGPFEEINQDLDEPRDIPIPGEGTVDVGPFIAGEEGEVVLKADEIAYTNTYLPPDESLPPINMSISCMPAEGEDSTIATIPIEGDGEDPPEDPVEPEIEVLGDDPYEIEEGEDFAAVDPGAEAMDEEDGDLTDDIETDYSELDTSEPGEYTVTYSVTNSAGESTTATRTVNVVEPDGEDPPEDPVGSIELEGNEEMELEVGEDFDDPGFLVVDEEGNDISDEVEVTVDGDVDTTIPDTYVLTYSVEGNDEIDSVTRTVNVVEPEEPAEPVGSIELEGNEEMELEVGEDFDDPGFLVVDEEGNDISDEVKVNIDGNVDTTTEGTYVLTYSVEDNENIDPVTRTVTVVESEEPGDPEPDPEGSNFLSGTSAPDNDLGEVGDHYLDTEAMELFVKEENDWNSLGVLRGDDGEPGDQGPPGEDGSMWFTDEGEPSADLGQEGDLYLDEDSGGVYQKEDGEWKFIANLEGPKGDCDCPEDNRDDNGNGSGSSGSNGSSNGSNGSSNGDNGSGIGNNDRDNGGSNYSDKNGSDASSERGGALPDTAGSTPVIILIGSLLTIGGVMLLIRRQLVV